MKLIFFSEFIIKYFLFVELGVGWKLGWALLLFSRWLRFHAWRSTKRDYSLDKSHIKFPEGFKLEPLRKDGSFLGFRLVGTRFGNHNFLNFKHSLRSSRTFTFSLFFWQRKPFNYPNPSLSAKDMSRLSQLTPAQLANNAMNMQIIPWCINVFKTQAIALIASWTEVRAFETIRMRWKNDVEYRLYSYEARRKKNIIWIHFSFSSTNAAYSKRQAASGNQCQQPCSSSKTI